MTATRRVHLGVQYNAEDPHEIWHRDLLPGINTTESFTQAAAIAERALFDFFFQAETSAIPEDANGISEPNVVGRVDNITAQSYLAARFRDVGFVSTINTSNNNPLDIARRLHSLDTVSPGHVGWNLVLGGNPKAFENYRFIGDRGAIDRYEFAREMLEVVRLYLGAGDDPVIEYDGEYLRIRAKALGSPRSIEQPFVFYAGDSSRSRDLAVAHADAIYTHYASEAHGTRFYRDIHDRLRRDGRDPAGFRVFARLAVLVGDDDEDARQRQRELLPFQVHPDTVRQVIAAIWQTDPADFDVDGPFPAFDPPPGAEVAPIGSSLGLYWKGNAQRAADFLRHVAERTGFGARQCIVEASGTDLVVGGPATVASKLIGLVEARAADGFVIVPHIAGTWLDSFARLVVPELQERGAYPDGYADETLRERVLSDRVASPAR